MPREVLFMYIQVGLGAKFGTIETLKLTSKIIQFIHTHTHCIYMYVNARLAGGSEDTSTRCSCASASIFVPFLNFNAVHTEA